MKHAEAQRRWRAKNPTHKKRYRRTFTGYFVHCFSGMNTRSRYKKRRYFGIKVMSPEEWKQFLEETTDIRKELFNQWVLSGYRLRFAPSIDRINPDLGYTKGNCRWLSQWENSGLRRNSIVDNNVGQRLHKILRCMASLDGSLDRLTDLQKNTIV